MILSVQTIELLIDAGLSGDTLKNILAAIESDVTERNKLREHVTLSDAGSVTPAALRMRKMRENKRISQENKGVTERNSVTSQSVTSNINLSLEEKGIEESKKGIARGRNKTNYSELFINFWVEFPTDKGMSKLEAWKAWQKLSEDDWVLALSGIPGFRKWVAAQGVGYRVVHACRYLSQRRFDGFKTDVDAGLSEQGKSIHIMAGSDQWSAWEEYWIKTKGKKPPRDSKGGWHFPTEYPHPMN
jgi:hypothetical protein